MIPNMGSPNMGSPDMVRPDMVRPLEPLWRGLLVYRVLTLVSGIAIVVYSLADYASPAGAIAVLVIMVGWTAVTGFAYLGGWPDGPRGRVALSDLVVSAAVIGSTVLVQTPAQLAADVSVMGSIWTSGAVLACALAHGIRGGVAAAVVISGVLVAVSVRLQTELGDIQLLLLVALSIGFASTVLRRQADRLRTAIGSEAAMAERERLARAVHDGVLQVLGYVHRRGQQLGGEAAGLGALAGEQEVALRTLLTTGPAPVDVHGRRDLVDALRLLGSGRVSVSAPAHPLPMSARAVEELVAVVGAALANVVLHVGPDAPAWVLVEDMGREVEIGVRDEGPGIPAGRLVAAESEGRLGVARSMRGRVHDLRGTLACDTGPGRGTEWTIRVPREEAG